MNIFGIFKIKKNYRKTSEQQLQKEKQEIEKLEQTKLKDKNALRLYVTILFNNGEDYCCVYDMIDIKLKDHKIKCIAKLNKQFTDKYNFQANKMPENDFIKDVIIFPLKEINEVKYAYIDNNVLSLDGLSGRLHTFEIPSCSLIFTIDQPQIVETNRLLRNSLQQKIKQNVNQVLRCLKNLK